MGGGLLKKQGLPQQRSAHNASYDPKGPRLRRPKLTGHHCWRNASRTGTSCATCLRRRNLSCRQGRHRGGCCMVMDVHIALREWNTDARVIESLLDVFGEIALGGEP